MTLIKKRTNIRSFVLLALLIIFCCSYAHSQKQLIFIYKGNVIARYTEGSNFKFRLKNGQKKEGFIVELNDFSMITSNDTIQFISIGKVRGLSRRSPNKGIGGLLFLGGLFYVGIDQLNVALGYNKGGFGTSDWAGLAVGGVGAALVFIRPKYQRLKPGTLIRAIDYHSPYYTF